MTPFVSVVMSVYNGAAKVERTIDSILAQTFRDWEFIVVDDGSQDHSLEILQRYAAQDSRIHIIAQENQGLTRALNIGCRAARGNYIARQDCGDRSLPERLERQVQFLDSHPEVVAVGCGARRVTSQGETLGETIRQATPATITEKLIQEGVGILHAASMFRRSAWEQIGGYRPEFRYAQDSDLWLRMIERGYLADVPEILFEVEIETNGISAFQIERQRQLWNIARLCREARLRGESEQTLLAQAQAISNAPQAKSATRDAHLKAQYFIGSQLLNQSDPQCRSYFLMSLKSPSLALPSATKLLISYFRCGRKVSSG